MPGSRSGAPASVFKYLLEPGDVGRHGSGVGPKVLVVHAGRRRSVNTASHPLSSAITGIGL
jgi:hypothetical protein